MPSGTTIGTVHDDADDRLGSPLREHDPPIILDRFQRIPHLDSAPCGEPIPGTGDRYRLTGMVGFPVVVAEAPLL